MSNRQRSALDTLRNNLEPLSQQAEQYDSDTAPEEFRQEILNEWCRALNLKPKQVHIEPEEREALEKYARAYLLMAQCKEAAVRVSPTIWERIKSQMLFEKVD